MTELLRYDGSEPSTERLRPREREVLELMCDGLARKQISERLGVTVHVINDYQKVLYRAFGARSALETVVKAFRSGLIPLDTRTEQPSAKGA